MRLNLLLRIDFYFFIDGEGYNNGEGYRTTLKNLQINCRFLNVGTEGSEPAAFPIKSGRTYPGPNFL